MYKRQDIESGILDPEDPDFKEKKKWLDREWRSYRVNPVSYTHLPETEEAVRSSILDVSFTVIC